MRRPERFEVALWPHHARGLTCIIFLKSSSLGSNPSAAIHTHKSCRMERPSSEIFAAAKKLKRTPAANCRYLGVDDARIVAIEQLPAHQYMFSITTDFASGQGRRDTENASSISFLCEGVNSCLPLSVGFFSRAAFDIDGGFAGASTPSIPHSTPATPHTMFLFFTIHVVKKFGDTVDLGANLAESRFSCWQSSASANNAGLRYFGHQSRRRPHGRCHHTVFGQGDDRGEPDGHDGHPGAPALKATHPSCAVSVQSS